MKEATICFPVKGRRILLGLKKEKRGGENFGAGKWNGFGGKIKEGETAMEAAGRELKEEAGLFAEPSKLERLAFIEFYDNDNPLFSCHIFIAKKWTGRPQESDEMIPRWFGFKQIPFGQMWPTDRIWLPLILGGAKFTAKADFDPINNISREFRLIGKL